MNASERIDQLIEGLKDWRGKTLSGMKLTLNPHPLKNQVPKGCGTQNRLTAQFCVPPAREVLETQCALQPVSCLVQTVNSSHYRKFSTSIKSLPKCSICVNTIHRLSGDIAKPKKAGFSA